MTTRNTGGALDRRAVYAGVLLLFVLAVGSYLVYEISQVILTLLLTLLLVIIISGPVNYLHRRGLGRGWATGAVAAITILILWASGALIAPTVEEQGRQFINDLPALLGDVEALFSQVQAALGLEAGVELQLSALPGMAQNFVSGDMLTATADFGRALARGISLGVVALIATVYLVARPYPVINGFVALFPAGQRARVREVLGKVYHTVQRWLLGQLVAMTFIGVLSVISLSIIGIPFAVLLGVFSGLISFVPFIGAVVSVIPPVLLALTSEPVLALWVIVAYTAIQQIESQVIQPVVMSHAVALHPAVVLFGLLIMGTLFGIIGLLLAVPLVATLQVLVRELWVTRMDAMGTDPDPPEKQKKPGESGLQRWIVGVFAKRASRNSAGDSPDENHEHPPERGPSSEKPRERS